MKTWLLGLCVMAFGLAACVPATPPVLDPAPFAQASLAAIGTRLASRETLTATALWPTATATPTITPTPTATPTATDTATPTATPLPTGYVQTPGPLRQGPGRVYPILVTLAGAEEVVVLGQTAAADWLWVRLENGTEGWLLKESVAQDDPGRALPIITDLPATPTLPPPPPTPLPTATFTPFPYACEAYITNAAAPGAIVIIGSNWPPTTVLGLATITDQGNRYTSPDVIQTDMSGGFQYVLAYHTGTTVHYQVYMEGCARTMTFP